MEVAAVDKVVRRVDVDLDLGRAWMLLRSQEGLLLPLDEQAHVGIDPVLKLHLPHRHQLLALDSEILLPLVEKLVILAVPQVHVVVLLAPDVGEVPGDRGLRALDEVLLEVSLGRQDVPRVLLPEDVARILLDVAHQARLLALVDFLPLPLF